MIAKSPTHAPSVALACAPVHKLALGVAVGLVTGAAVFVLTVFHIGLHATGDGLNVGLLAQYFYGYEVSWKGSLIGFGWGCLTGFVAGWFVAFVRNVWTGIRLFTLRHEGELISQRDFLDYL